MTERAQQLQRFLLRQSGYALHHHEGRGCGGSLHPRHRSRSCWLNGQILLRQHARPLHCPAVQGRQRQNCTGNVARGVCASTCLRHWNVALQLGQPRTACASSACAGWTCDISDRMSLGYRTCRCASSRSWIVTTAAAAAGSGACNTSVSRSITSARSLARSPTLDLQHRSRQVGHAGAGQLMNSGSRAQTHTILHSSRPSAAMQPIMQFTAHVHGVWRSDCT